MYNQKIYQQIIDRAQKSEEYKNELLTDPIEAIKSLTGTNFSLPKNKTLIVEDQTDFSKIDLNIPKKRSRHNVELSEEELNLVSGGSDLFSNR